jgi:hypothetical protein
LWSRTVAKLEALTDEDQVLAMACIMGGVTHVLDGRGRPAYSGGNYRWQFNGCEVTESVNRLRADCSLHDRTRCGLIYKNDRFEIWDTGDYSGN